MEKIVIDNARCFRCGACAANFPTHFAFEDDGVKVINDKVTEETKAAVGMCPASAIMIEKVDE